MRLKIDEDNQKSGYSVKVWCYQDEQEQEGRQDQGCESVGDHRGGLLLWLSE